MINYTELIHRNKKINLFVDNPEQGAIVQIRAIAETELGMESNIAIMPDAHTGFGICIGFTSRTNKSLNQAPPISPEWIGVDIGCGVLSIIGELQKDIDFSELDMHIRKYVPLGFSIHNKCIKPSPALYVMLNKSIPETTIFYNRILKDACDTALKVGSRDVSLSLGTLGGGNHFIELGQSSTNSKRFALTIHTGSRNFGLSVANYHSKKAEKAYLKKILKTQDEIQEYITDMLLAQEYATLNRAIIAAEIVPNIFERNSIEIVESVHNNISKHINEPNVFFIRKGAIPAYNGMRVVIPANMRDGTLIGTVAWPTKEDELNANSSLPHGSGRSMSRSSSKKLIELEEFKKQMNGIWSSSVTENTVDEAPDAYKDTESIRSKILSVTKDVEIFNPVYNLKA